EALAAARHMAAIGLLRHLDHAWEIEDRTPASMSPASVRASDRDDDLAASVAFRQVSDRIRSLDQRIRPVDHRRDLARLDERLEGLEVLLLHYRVQPAQLLTHEKGHEWRSEQPAEESSGPASTAVATDDHESPLWGEGAAQACQRAAAGSVDDRVPAPRAIAEVLARVVDPVIRADRPNQVRLRGAAHGGDLPAERFGDLHGERSHAPGRADDKHCLPPLHRPL